MQREEDCSEKITLYMPVYAPIVYCWNFRLCVWARAGEHVFCGGIRSDHFWEAQFRSTEFTCVKGNEDSLSYGFDNTAGADCMVELYKKGLIWDTKVSSMTVRPHDPGGKTEVIRNPSDSTFYFVLYAADGGTICGHLQAYQ